MSVFFAYFNVTFLCFGKTEFFLKSICDLLLNCIIISLGFLLVILYLFLNFMEFNEEYMVHPVAIVSSIFNVVNIGILILFLSHFLIIGILLILPINSTP